MKKITKVLLCIVLTLCFVLSVSLLAACEGTPGKDGTNGQDGANGKDGVTPHVGEDGYWYFGDEKTEYKATGNNGVDGKSAYELYKQEHPEYTGTLEDWLASLKGAAGYDGYDGVNGKSAYELYKQEHPEYSGSLEEWLDSLQGVSGVTPHIGEDGYWYFGESKTEYKAIGVDGKSAYDLYVEQFKAKEENAGKEPLSLEEWLTSLNGAAGEKGEQGERGTLWFSGSVAPEDASHLEDVREGDFYFRTFSDFADRTGYEIYRYTDKAWTRLVDMSEEITPEEQEQKDGYHIANVDELVEFGKLVNAGDTFSGKTVYLDEDISLEYVENWEPIGKTGSTFKGIFDGQGKTISDLFINTPDKDNVGLFGCVESPAAVKGVNIVNASVIGSTNVGALIGSAFTGSVQDCHVSGLVQITGNYKVGGMLGGGYVRISDCSVKGSAGSFIKGIWKEGNNVEGDNVGGFIGYTGEAVHTISNIEVSGLAVEGTRKVGGVVGYLHYGVSIEKSSFTDGSVSSNATEEYSKGNKCFVGGIVGEYNGGKYKETINSINNCTVSKATINTILLVDNRTVNNIIAGGSRNASPVTTFSGNEATEVEWLWNGIGIDVGRTYIVDSAESLVAFAEARNSDVISSGEGLAVTIKLAEDIDLEGKEWQPLNGQWLIFDGNGHTIYNLNAGHNSVDKSGLVAYLGGGTIKNLTIDGASAAGSQAGVFVGQSEGGKIENCTLKGTITVVAKDFDDNEYSESWGGIGVFAGVLNASSSTVTGIIDEKCELTLDFTGFKTEIKNVSDDWLGGYYIPAEAPLISIENKAAVEIKVVGIDYILNASSNTVRIYSLDGLKWWRDEVNAWVANNYHGSINVKNFAGWTAYLENDIDLNGEEWEPIGHSQLEGDVSFGGTFDGNGHIIKNLKISQTYDKGSGFIARLVGNGAVKNIVFENVDVSGSSYLGAVVGRAGSSGTPTLTKITLQGDIKVSGGSYVGAVVGHMGAVADQITVNADKGSFVKGSSIDVGGIAGITRKNGGKYTNLTASIDVEGQSAVGGIVGREQGGNIYTDCKSTGTIKATNADGKANACFGDVVYDIDSEQPSQATTTVTDFTFEGTVIAGGFSGFYSNMGGDATFINSTAKVTYNGVVVTYQADAEGNITNK